MAQTFHITPAATFASLDESGKGRVAFTITNSSSKPLRAWPELKPLGSTQREWIEVEGQAERGFSANEAQVFTVLIKVPPGAAAGKYEFKLNVINADKSEIDGCTEGPPVQFRVETPAPPPAPTKWLWIAAAVLILLIGGAVALILKPSKEVKPPPVPTLPVVADTEVTGTPSVFPLLVRGGAPLKVTTKPSGRPARPTTLVVNFTGSNFPAEATSPEQAKLQPGGGSWLDRGLRPGEPTQIECNLTEAEAAVLPGLLARPDIYYTFVCFNTNQGFMKATQAHGQIKTTP